MTGDAMKTWWLSFCDPSLPKGSKFLGACIVMGDGMTSAIRNAYKIGCNPGGEVLGTPVEDDIAPFIDAKWRRRLLTKAECTTLDEEIQQTCAVARERAKESPA